VESIKKKNIFNIMYCTFRKMLCKKSIMVNRDFFSKIPGASFQSAGDDRTGLLYHWYWYGKDLTGEIGKFLVGEKFAKGSFFTFDEATAQGEFTRVEMRVNADPNEIVFHVEYFDGNGNSSDQQFIKSRIKKRLDSLTVISIVGSVASLLGVVLGIISLCR